MANQLIEIRITGEAVVLGNVHSKYIAELILATEDMIASVIQEQETDYRKDDIIIGLQQLVAGSFRLQFNPNFKELTLPAYRRIAEAINSSDYADLPSACIEAVKRMAMISKRFNATIELRYLNGTNEILATITPEIVIEPIPLITGMTSLYGYIISVGGKAVPKVRLELANGKQISCVFDVKLASSIGQRLYQWIGFMGEAKWDAKNYELKEFTVLSITPFEDTPVNQAFAELAELTSHYYENLEDADAYVTALRYEDEDFA